MTPSSNRKKGLPVIVRILIATGALMLIAAIVLPSFRCQATKTKQAEPKQYVGTMVRSEQAYFLEHGKFTLSLNELQVDIPLESTDYRYALTLQDGSPQPVMIITAAPKKPGLKSYTGVVFVSETDQEASTVGQICEAEQPSATPPVMPIAPQNISEPIPCPPGSQLLK